VRKLSLTLPAVRRLYDRTLKARLRDYGSEDEAQRLVDEAVDAAIRRVVQDVFELYGLHRDRWYNSRWQLKPDSPLAKSVIAKVEARADLKLEAAITQDFELTPQQKRALQRAYDTEVMTTLKASVRDLAHQKVKDLMDGLEGEFSDVELGEEEEDDAS